jgi:hypothetical protein
MIVYNYPMPFKTGLEACAAEAETRRKQGSLLLSALGLHAGANAAFKAHGALTGHSGEGPQFATGFRHGLEGQKLHPVASNVMTYGIGPESLVNYQLGQQLGQQTSGMSKGQTYRTLKKIRKNTAMTSDIQKAPLGRAVVPGINRILSDQRTWRDKVPTVARDAAPTLAQRAASGGLGAAAIAAAGPEAVVHMGLNAARKAVAGSDFGKKFMRTQATRGALQGPSEGIASTLKGWAQDLGVSPGSRYTRQLGEALHRETVNNPGGAAKFMRSMAGLGAQSPAGQAHLERLRAAPVFGFPTGR